MVLTQQSNLLKKCPDVGQHYALCDGVACKRMSWACELDSYICQNKNSMFVRGATDNHITKSTFQKNLEPCLWFLLILESSMP